MTRRRPKVLAALFLIGFSSWASAANTVSSFQVTKGSQPGSFFGGLEYAALQTSLQTISGFGVHFGYRYVLSHRVAVDGSLAQIYGSGAGAGISALYSAVNVSARYAPFAEFAQARHQIYHEGLRVFEESSEDNRTWAIGLQMNQLILNGTTSVFNATGLGLVVSYDTVVFAQKVRPELRYGMLSANNADMTALFFNFLIPF